MCLIIVLPWLCYWGADYTWSMGSQIGYLPIVQMGFYE